MHFFLTFVLCFPLFCNSFSQIYSGQLIDEESKQPVVYGNAFYSKDYHIIATDDFFISLEYFRVAEKKKAELILCAVHNRKKKRGKNVYRLTRQGNWNPEMVANRGFSVQVEFDR
jgi:hypothetical protein